ncbi:hypothetical protein [Saccharothrix luteola]|uniref:hypothetical protein n=1 Tax=Saccharothrix luteola TaxID=2893018 RepID=UPI001E3F3F05|nr:hypothetical protein [Saccharothrix luteola]MCC8247645.1 hypothetical protein [Saccharothrix luteola]
MLNGPDHNWWSLLNHILTDDAWAPFVRALVMMLLLGAFLTGVLIILGPAAAGIGAGGTLATGAGKRYLARRRNRKARGN